MMYLSIKVTLNRWIKIQATIFSLHFQKFSIER